MTQELITIATMRTPFAQKFAIPRQPNLVDSAIGDIVFTKQFADSDFLRQIEGFSHLWILFIFHATAEKGWSPTVQPPRLGGKERVGVFASRSPFRPNPIGLSVVRNLGIVESSEQLILRVGGVDMLDGTPVIDIKPYVAYADALPDAVSGFAEQAPGHGRKLVFTEQALPKLAEIEQLYPGIEGLIRGVLSQDPRPAWRTAKDDSKQYGMTLYDINIKWRIDEDKILILDLEQMSS